MVGFRTLVFHATNSLKILQHFSINELSTFFFQYLYSNPITYLNKPLTLDSMLKQTRADLLWFFAHVGWWPYL